MHMHMQPFSHHWDKLYSNPTAMRMPNGYVPKQTNEAKMNMTRSNKSDLWFFTVRGEPDMDSGGAVPVLVAIFHQLMLE